MACGRMAACPFDAQTGRRSGAGPVRGLLGGKNSPAACSSLLDAANHLPTGLAVDLVPFLPTAIDKEPVHACTAVEIVSGVVVADRRRGEAERAVQAAGQCALEVFDAGVVVS